MHPTKFLSDSTPIALQSKSLQVVARPCWPTARRENGPSRHYLCNPYVGAWTRTPQCSPGALDRFSPGDNGLTSHVIGSAHQTLPAMQLQQGKVFRSCSHSFMFRHPHSLDPQVAPTADTCNTHPDGVTVIRFVVSVYLP